MVLLLHEKVVYVALVFQLSTGGLSYEVASLTYAASDRKSTICVASARQHWRCLHPPHLLCQPCRLGRTNSTPQCSSVEMSIAKEPLS